ncbi:MAG: hypothetical protein V3U02_11710 [Calditrichia bacterium]|jgi:hypothetical protein
MTDSTIDLGNLLSFIIDQKKVNTTVNIGPECKVNAEDPKPLVKIINYLINYLNQITDDTINVSLKTQSNGCLLCFIVSTNHEQLPPLSDNLDEALKPYNAAMRVVFEEGKYAQIILNFCEGHLPDSVVIEV